MSISALEIKSPKIQIQFLERWDERFKKYYTFMKEKVKTFYAAKDVISDNHLSFKYLDTLTKLYTDIMNLEDRYHRYSYPYIERDDSAIDKDYQNLQKDKYNLHLLIKEFLGIIDFLINLDMEITFLEEEITQLNLFALNLRR